MRVYLRWLKEINFGDIEAKSPEEAVEIACNRLVSDPKLLEEEISSHMEVENEKGKVIYQEKY